jgi:hypothetical protein
LERSGVFNNSGIVYEKEVKEEFNRFSKKFED